MTEYLFLQLSKIISKFVVQSLDCRHNYAESVSLFSLGESGKFKRENGLTSFASYHSVWRGVVAYFFSKAFQSPLNRISFQHHAFFLCYSIRCWWAKRKVIFMAFFNNYQKLSKKDWKMNETYDII